MKKLYAIILFLGFLLPLEAQTTSKKSYVVEEEQFMEQQLIDAKNCFFKKQEDVSRLWKLNLIDLLNTSTVISDPIIGIKSGLSLGYERRLGVGRSLDINLGASSNIFRSNKSNQEESLYSDYHGDSYGVEFSIAHKLYLFKKENIARGLSGNNLSGIYTSVLLGIDWESHTYDATYVQGAEPVISNTVELMSIQTKYQEIEYSTSFNLGIQRQFTKNGFFDFHIGTGLRRTTVPFYDYHIINGKPTQFRMLNGKPVSEIEWGALFNYNLSLGFTLDNQEIRELPKDCSVFEYHTNKQRIIKLSLINPNKLFNQDFFEGRLTAGIEQKISNSVFSINANINYFFSVLLSDIDIDGVAYGVVEPRYYYDLKKRMAQGKTGNSFSANYVGLRSRFGLRKGKHLAIAPVWGIQRQFFKHLLFDYKVGPELFLARNDKDIRFFSELKIGLAF